MNSDNPWIPPYALWLLGLAVLGWSIGPLWGFYWGKRSQIEIEHRKAKYELLAVIADQRVKFETMKWREAEFFAQSVATMTTAVPRMKPFLSDKQWTRLHTILQEYQSHQKSEFEGGRARLAAAIAADLGTGKTHAQILLEYLDRFEECVKKIT